MRQAIVTLKKGEGRLLKSGGAWIFDNEIDSIMGEFENGDIVIVHDFDGYGMGRGFINMNSKIRIRMMTRKQDQEIDHAFLEMRVHFGKSGFLIVDAYNNEAPLGFYQKNEFLFLFSTEQQEAENLGYDITKTLHTRLMYYDLKKLTSIA